MKTAKLEMITIKGSEFTARLSVQNTKDGSCRRHLVTLKTDAGKSAMSEYISDLGANETYVSFENGIVITELYFWN